MKMLEIMKFIEKFSNVKIPTDSNGYICDNHIDYFEKNFFKAIQNFSNEICAMQCSRLCDSQPDLADLLKFDCTFIDKPSKIDEV